MLNGEAIELIKDEGLEPTKDLIMLVNSAYELGHEKGFQEGRKESFDEGYDEGYEQGVDALEWQLTMEDLRVDD